MFTVRNPRALTTEELHQARRLYALNVTWVMDYGPCVAYLWEANGRFMATGFVGKAAKPAWGYYFKREEDRGRYCDVWAARQMERAGARAERAAERKADNAAGHPLQMHDVLYTSWGYDQTNVDWYVVTKLIGKTMVELTECCSERVETGPMQGQCIPIPTEPRPGGRVCRVKVGKDGTCAPGGHHARRADFTEVGGVKVYKAVAWSSYH